MRRRIHRSKGWATASLKNEGFRCSLKKRAGRFPIMPILPKQRDIFPEGLFDDSLAGSGEAWKSGRIACDEADVALPGCDDGSHRWFAFYTLSRREKDLMRKLEAAAVPYYAPLISRRLRSPGGRTRMSFVPLFPGYVFSLVDDSQRRIALASNTIADRPLTPEARLESGQPVRVRSGPLQGMEGMVVKRQGEQRLVVAVRFLNQGASIELEDVDLEPL